MKFKFQTYTKACLPINVYIINNLITIFESTNLIIHTAKCGVVTQYDHFFHEC